MAGIWIGQDRYPGGTEVAGSSSKTSESPANIKTLESPTNEKTSESSANEKMSESLAKEKTSESPANEATSESPANETTLESLAKEKTSESPANEATSESPAKEKTLESPAKEKTLKSPAKEKTLESLANKRTLESPANKKGITVNPPKKEQNKDSKMEQLAPGAPPESVVDPKAKKEPGSDGKKLGEVNDQLNVASGAGGSRSQSQIEGGLGKPTPLPRLKTKLKLSTDKVSQGQGAEEATSSPTVPESPWGIYPLTPGAMDLQSPVIIIGDEVFQVIDDCPPPPAPFPHRIVTLRQDDVATLYDLNMNEIIGGGRYGEVHLCKEKSSDLQLVAKVLKLQSSREREMALNEIGVMNQLDHRNLIQMFDAVETPTEIFLFLEYVEGGELFERIIDENYQLTELDAMVYVRQICEGIFYMHQMYVLHLDLKPDNIVYKPQKKLKVSFGTAEFLAPEVVNFDFVSFPTDMWSVGVITYMMVSGLSPFLGDNETETLNNVLSGNIDFDEEPFELVSDEGKDFISNLMIREKSGRMSAAQCLKHPWLNDLARKAKLCHRLLKSQIELRKYMMRRRWKKNVFAVTAANRFLKISSSSCLTSLGE
ncbi:myosin light chain kinase 2, skeletal/cardiac muscle isoform X2 [Spea bombifrons]|uniref:myosin light chain kinase 2, skeletal/cardiac muscle isoform X2 n=1 Tax=Spea bombifrons TaxID=233779 RepID=UPI00234AED55|nr:myosin light chain kinase 2, skeletal/cardiac muscle isoform X2 [Spea bombifrons]